MRTLLFLALFSSAPLLVACKKEGSASRERAADEDDERSKKPSRREGGDRSSGASAAFKLKGTSFKPSEAIDVSFDRPLLAPDGQQYWITLVEASQPDSTYGAWHYLKSGALGDKLVAGAPGEYEVRLYDLYPATKNKVLARQRVTVVECRESSDCPGTGPACEGGKCVGAGSSPVPIETASPTDLAPDGWPVVMPPPGSKAPTTAEWAAVPREVTVKGSSGLRCETKVVREWLRVSCHANSLGVPVSVTHQPAYGQQAFTFVSEGSVASVVVQMIQPKTYTADFTWSGVDVGTSTYTLTATWSNGRPVASFNVPGGF